jgi:hypothetical protein
MEFDQLMALVRKSGRTSALLLVCQFFAEKTGTDLRELISYLEAFLQRTRDEGVLDWEPAPTEDLLRGLRRSAGSLQ